MGKGKSRGYHAIRSKPFRREEAIQNGWEDLQTAIVAQACSDYLFALRGITRTTNGMKMENTEQLERFFRGDWFRRLCSVNGDDLIEQLRALFAAGKTAIHYGRYSMNHEED